MQSKYTILFGAFFACAANALQCVVPNPEGGDELVVVEKPEFKRCVSYETTCPTDRDSQFCKDKPDGTRVTVYTTADSCTDFNDRAKFQNLVCCNIDQCTYGRPAPPPQRVCLYTDPATMITSAQKRGDVACTRYEADVNGRKEILHGGSTKGCDEYLASTPQEQKAYCCAFADECNYDEMRWEAVKGLSCVESDGTRPEKVSARPGMGACVAVDLRETKVRIRGTAASCDDFKKMIDSAPQGTYANGHCCTEPECNRDK
jgi:hypothetical protein